MQNDTLMTSEGRAALQAEVDTLIAQRPALAARIKSARELGDLKENAEYHAAKDEQGFLETRILQIERQLRTAVVIEQASTDRVSVGTRVIVKELDSGDEETWTITGVEEADPMLQRVSYESPIGSALMDKTPGEVVEVQLPRGVMRLEIIRLEA
ncbi:MAG: transcription elongation factor GreA [Thermoleophilia bacterium]|nr:transcription elongation factor GreA [Thermoleophilia bacterium]